MLTLMAKPIIYRIEPLSYRTAYLSKKHSNQRLIGLFDENRLTHILSKSGLPLFFHETSHLFYVLSLRKLTISSKIYVRVYFSMKLYVDYFV